MIFFYNNSCLARVPANNQRKPTNDNRGILRGKTSNFTEEFTMI